MKRLLLFIVLTVSTLPQMMAAEIKAFGVGEKLYYRMHWKNITGAYAMVEVKERKTTDGRDSFHFQAKMTSNNTLVDSFFKIRDKIDCWWDIERRQPLRSHFNIHEGYYFRKLKVRYDFPTKKAHYDLKEFKGNTSERGVRNKDAKWEQEKGSYDIPADFQDVVSSFFLMRSYEKNGTPGQKFSLKVFTDKKMNVLDMTILKRETVKVASGTYKAIKVQPYIAGNKFFESYGKVYIWVSDDQYRYPVKIAAVIPYVGTISGELVKVVKGK